MMCLQFIPSPEPESAWANRGLIRLRGDFGFGAGFNPDHRTASQLLSQCEAAHLRLSYLYKALSFRIGCGYHLEQLAHAIFLV